MRRAVTRRTGAFVSAADRRMAVLAAAAGLIALLAMLPAGCGSGASHGARGPVKVIATTSFLRDIAQNVAGQRLSIGELIPVGVDPHEWQPAPADLAAVARSDMLIVNGGGLEGTLLKAVANAGGTARVVTASSGLASRVPKPGEPDYGKALAVDPHWWLDPMDVITYVTNIRHALVAADHPGAGIYQANAAAYIQKLKALDAWIRAQVASVPPANRLLVMNHLSHGYFADRYGFKVAGAVIPSVTAGASVTPSQMAGLVRSIERLHVKAIFVELEENPKLADQIASAAHVKVVTGLLDHSLTSPSGPAPDYIAMMKYDTRMIVENLR
jgi:ABC-type Zn uptake system ZnuABC Zn-binding protein ZnuA